MDMQKKNETLMAERNARATFEDTQNSTERKRNYKFFPLTSRTQIYDTF